MDFGSTRVYEYELWSSNGYRVADISSLVHDRSITLELNEAEELTFVVDLYEIERFAASIGTSAAELLMPYQMDVRVKRSGAYWIGTQIVAASLQISGSSSMGKGMSAGGRIDADITVTCRGYLDLFKDRYLSLVYAFQDRSLVACDLIMQAQAVSNGDVGVTLAATQYSTGRLDADRALSRDNVKRYIQDLSELPESRFDFAFSPDKQFRTYSMLGSDRTDVAFTFGGPTGNISGLYLERSAVNLSNQIIGLASGFGNDQVSSIQGDTPSQLNNFLRESIKQYNSISSQEILSLAVAADLAKSKDPLQIPQITISGAELRNVNFLELGDRIPLKFIDHSFFKDNDGLYRIAKMQVALDENDFERSIELYFDNYDLRVA